MMYQIFYLGQPVYGPDVENCILEPKLDVELNSAGTLTFTVPIENEFLWNNIEVFRGEVLVYEEDDIIWFGRPFQIVRNWKNQKVVTCEGALSYFNDSVQATHTYDDNWNLYLDEEHTTKGFFNRIVELHNDMVRIGGEDTSRQIFVGNINVDNENDIYREVDYETTADILQNMCLDTNGGYFILRKEIDPTDGNLKSYIDWVKDMPYRTTQKIAFGSNLLDVNQDLNGADICTVLLAFGKDDKTIAGLNKYTSEDHADGNGVYHDGKDSEYLVHTEGYKKYGRVLKVKEWSDILANDSSGKEQLFNKASEWLNDQNTDILTIECDAADLHYIETDDPADKGKLRIGQKVTVLSPIHNLNASELSIFKISMSLDSGAKHITMGTPPKRELTDIVKSGGGSTRGSSGTTGGGGGSEDSGGGSGTVSIPVKDVQVKNPGDDKFITVVKKKVAKIDLSNIAGGVTDVRLNGTTIVNNHIADIISSDIVEANPEGTSTGDLTSIKIGDDKYDIPSINPPVVDVTLDGESIVNPNTHVAEILSRDIIEEGIEGNFEHVVTKDNNFPSGHPSKDFGKKTDILIETDIDDAEIRLMNSGDDLPVNLQEIGGWYSYTQDAIVDPIGYYDKQGNWKYDPETRTRLYNNIVCDGGHKSAPWWFPDVEGAEKPYSDHFGTIETWGYKINNTGYPDITFEKHVPGVRYKPTRVVGTFAFRSMHAGGAGYRPEEEDFCDSSIIRIHVSNDGENWTTFAPTSEPESGSGTYEFGIDEYYSYIRMTCTNYLYHGAGYLGFTVFAIPESSIKNLWYKTENKAWIKQHIPKIIPNPSEQATDELEKLYIDGDIYELGGGTEVIPNPSDPATDDLDTIQIGEDIFNIAGGTTVIANPQAQPTSRLNTIQIGDDTYRVSAGGGDQNVVDFYYTGDIQTFTAPENGTYKLEVWGAQGGSPSNDVHGGYGGYSVGTIDLDEGDTIYICVGGAGGNDSSDPAAYNGGGLANFGGSRGNGGGATHIATAAGELSDLSSNRSAVILVAGGGGGAGHYGYGDSGDGGSGGGFIGGYGLFNGSTTGDGNSNTGSGGAQSTGGGTENYPTQSLGTFGQGANRDDGDLWGGSGGGGGWYGGGASTNNAGAGGGSGYINTSVLSDAAMYGYDVQTSAADATKTYSVSASSSDPTSQIAKEGNGHARISYGGGEFDPYVTVGDLYDACVANNVTPTSKSLVDIVAALLGN